MTRKESTHLYLGIYCLKYRPVRIDTLNALVLRCVFSTDWYAITISKTVMKLFICSTWADGRTRPAREVFETRVRKPETRVCIGRPAGWKGRLAA